MRKIDKKRENWKLYAPGYRTSYKKWLQVQNYLALRLQCGVNSIYLSLYSASLGPLVSQSKRLFDALQF